MSNRCLPFLTSYVSPLSGSAWAINLIDGLSIPILRQFLLSFRSTVMRQKRGGPPEGQFVSGAGRGYTVRAVPLFAPRLFRDCGHVLIHPRPLSDNQAGCSGLYRIVIVCYRVMPRFLSPPDGQQRRGLADSRSATGGCDGYGTLPCPCAEYRGRHTPNPRLVPTARPPLGETPRLSFRPPPCTPAARPEPAAEADRRASRASRP